MRAVAIWQQPLPAPAGHHAVPPTAADSDRYLCVRRNAGGQGSVAAHPARPGLV